jgi:hypothetical protein
MVFGFAGISSSLTIELWLVVSQQRSIIITGRKLFEPALCRQANPEFRGCFAVAWRAERSVSVESATAAPLCDRNQMIGLPEVAWIQRHLVESQAG